MSAVSGGYVRASRQEAEFAKWDREVALTPRKVGSGSRPFFHLFSASCLWGRAGLFHFFGIIFAEELNPKSGPTDLGGFNLPKVKGIDMEPLVIASRFAAYTWYLENRKAARETAQEEALKFAQANWRTFLPVANKGFGRLMLRVAKKRACALAAH